MKPKPNDYVVAIDLATGTAVAAWPGETYRTYDKTKVHQYQVALCESETEACKRAEGIHTQVQQTLSRMTSSVA